MKIIFKFSFPWKTQILINCEFYWTEMKRLKKTLKWKEQKPLVLFFQNI